MWRGLEPPAGVFLDKRRLRVVNDLLRQAIVVIGPEGCDVMVWGRDRMIRLAVLALSNTYCVTEVPASSINEPMN